MKRVLGVFAAVILMAVFSAADAVRYQSEIRDKMGNVVPGARIRVCTEPASGTPCMPLTTVYADAAKLTVKTTVMTDSAGMFFFYADPGVYHLQVSGPGFSTFDIPDISLLAYSAAPSGTPVFTTPSTTQTITQPVGTSLDVVGVSSMQNMNGIRFADKFANIQAAITDAGSTGVVIIPSTYSGTDSYTNPNEIAIFDLRPTTVRDIDIRKHGAKLDLKQVGGCSVTTGSPTLTCTTASFTTADVGKLINVYGATGSGLTPFKATILSRNGATQVTLSANSTITNAASGFAVYGTDIATALNEALTEMGETVSHKLYGGRILIPGCAMLGSQVTVFNKAGLMVEGLGWGLTSTSDPGPGSCLVWSGNTTDSMVQFKNSSGSGIRNIHLIGFSGSKPLACINLHQVNTEGHPNNKILVDNVYCGTMGGYDPDNTKQFQNLIYASGYGANNDQHTFNRFNGYGADTCINMPDAQSTDNRWADLFIGQCDTGFTTVGRHEIHNAFFSGNLVDFRPLTGARLNVYGFGSEGSGRMAVLDYGGVVWTLKGGAWQAGSNLNADGQYIQVNTSGGVIDFDSFNLSKNAPPVTPVLYRASGTTFTVRINNSSGQNPENYAITVGGGGNQFAFIEGSTRSTNQGFPTFYRNMLTAGAALDFFRYDLWGKVNVFGALTVKQLTAPAAGACIPAGGTGTTYSYRARAVSNGKEGAVTSAFTCSGGAVLGGAVTNKVRFAGVIGADQYKIYGRTSGAEQLLATVNGSTYINAGTDLVEWTDDGSVAPSGAIDSTNRSGYLKIDGPLEAIGSSTLTGGALAPWFSTSSANPASAGTFRLSNNQFICWRDFNNLNDSCLRLSTADLFVFGRGISTSGQIISTVGGGTAPFQVSSATPVETLVVASHPQVYVGGTSQYNAKIYTGTQALTAGAATHTFAAAFAFANTNYVCTSSNASSTSGIRIQNTSTTQITLTGTGTDTVSFICIGI